MRIASAPKCGIFVALLLGSGGLHAQQFGNGRWVDLTHVLDEDSAFWPTAKMFEKETVFEGRSDIGFYYGAYNG